MSHFSWWRWRTNLFMLCVPFAQKNVHFTSSSLDGASTRNIFLKHFEINFNLLLEIEALCDKCPIPFHVNVWYTYFALRERMEQGTSPGTCPPPSSSLLSNVDKPTTWLETAVVERCCLVMNTVTECTIRCRTMHPVYSLFLHVGMIPKSLQRFKPPSSQFE